MLFSVILDLSIPIALRIFTENEKKMNNIYDSFEENACFVIKL